MTERRYELQGRPGQAEEGSVLDIVIGHLHGCLVDHQASG
jgi:hypothetical protein